jgi:hypothetical protein
MIFNETLNEISERIDKIKQFFSWNQQDYAVSVQPQPTTPSSSLSSIHNDNINDTPSRPQRRRKLKRNSVAPSENADVKVIEPQMHVNDLECNDDRKDDINLHI